MLEFLSMKPTHFPQRIVCVGTSGCGKTTMAKKLSALTGISAVDLDDLYWLPGWHPLPETQFDESVKELVERESWIISGNQSKLIPLMWSRAELVIWLDYPLYKLVWRVVKRTVRRIWSGEECCNGNYETVSRFFSRRSILYFVIAHYRKRKRVYGRLFESKEYPNAEYIRIRTQSEEKRFWKKFKG